MGPVQPTAPADAQAPYTDDGKGNYNLPEHLQGGLRQLIARFESDNRQPRSEEVKRCQRQRDFFSGRQNRYYDEQMKRWMPIATSGSTVTMPAAAEMDVQFDFVENIYRAHSEISMAVLRQNPPHCRFVPQDFNDPADVATAKAAETVAELISDNNKLDKRQAEVVWFFNHDGLAATYTYYDVSKERYGAKVVQPEVEASAPLMPAVATCPQCGAPTEIETPPEGVPPSVPDACVDCGAPMGPETYTPAVEAPIAVPQGPAEEIPRGQERILVMGALEFARPYSARTLEECHWVTWEAEVHRAWIKSIYQHVSKKLGTSVDGSDKDESNDGRQARIALKATSYGREGADGNQSLVTFRRTWIRSWAFLDLEDEKISKELTALFPDGVYVAFAGPTYCESKPERIEERWALRHPFPGDGMIRDGTLTDLVDEQRKLNTQENIKMETFERMLGSRFIDGEALDYDAYMDAGAGVNDFSIKLRPGQKASDVIYDSSPGAVSPQMVADGEGIRGGRSQFLTGHFPSLFGGDTGSNKTAAGISIVKDSASGRQSLFKEAMNELYADTMVNAIACFKKNRTEDVAFAVMGRGAELDSKIIKLEELQGNIYARTDASESYPFSPEQKRAIVLELVTSPNQAVQAALITPDNFELLKNSLGLKDLKLGGEDARRKQYREIEQMKEGMPVQVDAFLDAHQYEIAALSEWANSDDGQAADPQTRELARQHMNSHLLAQAQIQQILASYQPQPAMPAEGQGQGQAPMTQ